MVPDHGPWSFDLIDLREEERLARLHAAPKSDVDPHTFFVLKQHLGIAAGYDNGIAHGSVGYYLTVAEWGRWNFGVPSVEIGVGRYAVIDRASQRPIMKEQMTFLVSLASAHYRMGYVRAWGLQLLPESRAGVRPARQPQRFAVRPVVQHQVSGTA